MWKLFGSILVCQAYRSTFPCYNHSGCISLRSVFDVCLREYTFNIKICLASVATKSIHKTCCWWLWRGFEPAKLPVSLTALTRGWYIEMLHQHISLCQNAGCMDALVQSFIYVSHPDPELNLLQKKPINYIRTEGVKF